MNETATTSNELTYFQGNTPVKTIIPTLKSLLSSPAEFFAGLPFQVFHRNSLFYSSIIIFAMIFISVPFYSLGMLFLIPFIWGILLIGMWFLASYLSWAVRSFGGGKLSPANAFQIQSYAMTPLALIGLSWFGIVAFTANVFLLWLGIKQYCNITGGRAAAVIIVPVLVVLLVGGGMMVALSQLGPLGN